MTGTKPQGPKEVFLHHQALYIRLALVHIFVFFSPVTLFWYQVCCLLFLVHEQLIFINKPPFPFVMLISCYPVTVCTWSTNMNTPGGKPFQTPMKRSESPGALLGHHTSTYAVPPHCTSAGCMGGIILRMSWILPPWSQGVSKARHHNRIKYPVRSLQMPLWKAMKVKPMV